MGDGRIFLKNLRNTSFNKDLSNEPTFGRIHLAGHYSRRRCLAFITEFMHFDKSDAYVGFYVLFILVTADIRWTVLLQALLIWLFGWCSQALGFYALSYSSAAVEGDQGQGENT